MNEREGPLYQEWRRLVLRRDRGECQMPGCTRRRGCQVHHIQRWADAPALRYEVDNGITLCGSCHYRIRNQEKHFIHLFMQIVASKR